MGHLEIIRHFPSLPERGARTLRIYTPTAYETHPGPFPVLYMQDGQNLFDHPQSAIPETWGLNTALEWLIESGQIEPWIIVAVDHRGVDRIADYSPWDEPQSGVRGRGVPYATFVAEHLKPWVETHYRVRPGPEWTAVGGSSLGGLMALYLGWRHPQLFGRIGAFSPSVMWAEGALFHHWLAHSRHYSRIYLDAGAEERFQAGPLTLEYGAAVRAFHGHLCGIGYLEHELRLHLEPGGQHSEPDWRRRLPGALRWLLG